MTTPRPRPTAPTRTRRDWWIPASAHRADRRAGRWPAAARLVDLLGGRTEENARFFDLPLPIIVHIVGATTYCVLGAFQFHAVAAAPPPALAPVGGRILVPAGLAAALSGMWMAVFSDLPAHDNAALVWLRLLFGSIMVAGLVLGVRAVLRRDIRTHQRWMARAYAVAQGAGTQALVLGPVAIVVGEAVRNAQGGRDGLRLGPQPRGRGVAGAAQPGPT